jgi:hypothetical protein
MSCANKLWKDRELRQLMYRFRTVQLADDSRPERTSQDRLTTTAQAIATRRFSPEVPQFTNGYHPWQLAEDSLN